MPLRYANLILGSKSNLYRLVVEEGWYLPRVEARCCTSKYLFGIMNGEYFRIKTSDIKPSLVERVRLSKIDIIAYLDSNLLKGVKHGFSPEALPDRAWLLNLLHTIDPNNEVFSGSSSAEPIVQIPVK
jgi:hypothetical protein